MVEQHLGAPGDALGDQRRQPDDVVADLVELLVERLAAVLRRHGASRLRSPDLGGEVAGLAGDQVPEPAAPRIAAWSAMRSRAWPATSDRIATRTASGPSRREQLLDQLLAGQVDRRRAGGQLGRPGRGPGSPRPAAPSRKLLDGLVGHDREDVEAAGELGRSSSCSGPSFTTRRARSPTRSSSPMHPQHRHDEPQVGRHRALPGQQVVAALGERHVHGVDLVVGRERLRGRGVGVAGREDLAHALEVLVDAHAHELDLQAELLELGCVGWTAGSRRAAGTSAEAAGDIVLGPLVGSGSRTSSR